MLAATSSAFSWTEQITVATVAGLLVLFLSNFLTALLTERRHRRREQEAEAKANEERDTRIEELTRVWVGEPGTDLLPRRPGAAEIIRDLTIAIRGDGQNVKGLVTVISELDSSAGKRIDRVSDEVNTLGKQLKTMTDMYDQVRQFLDERPELIGHLNDLRERMPRLENELTELRETIADLQERIKRCESAHK